MEGAFTKNRILAGIVAAVAICGAMIALAADPAKQPVEPNQCEKGRGGEGSSTTMPASAPLLDPVSEFRRAFKSAATGPQRRDLVMKACDDRVISSRMNLDDVKKLFGDSPMFTLYPIDKETGTQSALLGFTPPPPASTQPGGIIQRAEYTWYMWFRFDRSGLTLYYLTNYGKG